MNNINDDVKLQYKVVFKINGTNTKYFSLVFDLLICFFFYCALSAVQFKTSAEFVSSGLTFAVGSLALCGSCGLLGGSGEHISFLQVVSLHICCVCCSHVVMTQYCSFFFSSVWPELFKT